MEYIDLAEYRIVQLVPAPAGWRVYAPDGLDSMPVAAFALLEDAQTNRQFLAPIVSTEDGLIPSRLRAVPADERDHIVYTLTDEEQAKMEAWERREAERPQPRSLWEAVQGVDAQTEDLTDLIR